MGVQDDVQSTMRLGNEVGIQQHLPTNLSCWEIYLGTHQVALHQEQSSKLGKSSISRGFIWKIAFVQEGKIPNRENTQ